MTVQPFIENFHFLRPLWLLAVIPAALITLYFWQQKSSAVNWRGAINQQLLQHLVDGASQRLTRWPWLVLFFSWTIAALAMAGPSWEKLPQPVHQRQDALVIVLDLSLSMLAEDIKPSRLVRARHKVLDILNQRNEGLSALIAYSGDAHIVSPLTDDTPTIANLTPSLAPDMMPVFGSNPVDALTLAKQLFKNAGINNGRVLLITDGITQNDLDDIDNDLRSNGFELSIMGIGTTDGAPIPTSEGFLKNSSGKIVVPQLHRPRLEQLAKRNDGRYTDASLSNNDINFLLPDVNSQLDDNTRLTEREFDQWHDRGPLLCLLLLPFALLAFRKGWLLVLPLMLALEPQTSYAFEWQDLWQRPDQRAARALEQGDNEAAAEQFENDQWRGTANYKAGNYEQAAENFSQPSDQPADSHYNRGNALARAGQLDEAIEAYNNALELQPDMEDARANKQLIEQLKQQQEQQESQSSEGDGSEQDSADQQQSEQQSEQQQSEQNNGEQSEQKEGEQSSSQQQQSEQDQADASQQPNQPTPEEQEQEQEQQKQAQQSEQNEDTESEQAQQAESESAEIDPQTQQQQQAMEQWLRQIPDDPSGLLRRKFNYEYRLRQQQGERQKEQPQW